MDDFAYWLDYYTGPLSDDDLEGVDCAENRALVDEINSMIG
jgi:hypothetical protein